MGRTGLGDYVKDPGWRVFEFWVRVASRVVGGGRKGTARGDLVEAERL